jgi:hypothetical protein
MTLRRRPRRDPVSPTLALHVFARDGGCIAPLLGGSVMDCWGRLTAEHVKDELRMGVRAPSDMSHLVTLCEGHTEPGRRAGYQWNTAKDNRARVRDYLAHIESPHSAHVDPCGPTCREAQIA